MAALLFVPLNEQGVSIPAIRFHFNMYTGPVYLSAFLDIINIILIVSLFREYKLDFRTEKEKTGSKCESDIQTGGSSQCFVPPEVPV